MKKRKIWVLVCLSLFIPQWLWSQSTEKIQVEEVQIGPGLADEKFLEVQTEFERGLPAILDRLKMSLEHVKKNEWDSAKEDIRIAAEIRDRDEAALTKDSHYQEIADYVDRIETAVDTAMTAMDQKQKQAALNNLEKAYRLTHALSQSPVLKLSDTEIALGKASGAIGRGNYQDAAWFLQRAIDNLSAVMQDPKLQGSEDLSRLKNQIILTHKQVVLGEMKDAEKIKSFYPGLAAARENTLNSYYSVWNRSDYPWMQY